MTLTKMKTETIDLEKVYQMRDMFILKMKGRPYFPSQREFSNRIVKSVLLNLGDVLAAAFTRQHGKTTVVTETLDFLFLFYFSILKKHNITTYPFFNIGFFAPQQQQAQTGYNSFKSFLQSCKQKGFDFEFGEFNGDTITINDGVHPQRQAYCFTASPTSHPESKTLNVIVYDEAQDMRDMQIEKAIEPMGSSTNATQIYIGVGGYQRCKFWNFLQTLPDDKKLIIPYQLAIQERDDMFVKTGNPIYANYRKFMEGKLRRDGVGEDSDHFKTQYLLQWILERGQFITYENLMLLEKDYKTDEDFNGVATYGGIDWGKAHDSTVLTVVDINCRVLGWFEWIGDDYNSQIEDISLILKNRFRGMKILHCDSTGNQDMGVDNLRARMGGHGLSTVVVGVNFSAVSKDGMYKNVSRLMHGTKIDGKQVEEAKLCYPKNYDWKKKERFVKEFLDLQKEIKNDKWSCHHPEGPQYHDDYTDSLALACYAFRPQTIPNERRFLIAV